MAKSRPMTAKQIFTSLATNPASLLDYKNSNGDYIPGAPPLNHLQQCHCSEIVDRRSTNNTYDSFDQQLIKHLKLGLKEPIHIVDVGPGLLFSTAVTVAKLVQAGATDIHLYLVDPLYGDEKQNKNYMTQHAEDQEGIRLCFVQEAFPDFVRLMKEGGIRCIPENKTNLLTNCILRSISTDSKKLFASKETKLHLYTYSTLSDIQPEQLKKIKAVMAVDVWPPIGYEALLGEFTGKLKDGVLILTCLQSPPTKDELQEIFQIAMEEIKIAVQESLIDLSPRFFQQIGMLWSGFVDNRINYNQVDAGLIKLKEEGVPDKVINILQRAFYHSGNHEVVTGFSEQLRGEKPMIKTQAKTKMSK